MPEVQVKLTEFSELIDRYTKDFFGREWLVNQVTDLLAKPDCRFIVLTGRAGVGKTAFMAHLAATHPRWPRYFIRRDSKGLLRPGDAKTFLLTVGGQLATLYPHLFHPENLEVVVRQRIGSVEAGGEAIGARIKELYVSPFYQVALLVEQEIRKVAGKVTGLEVGRLVSEPRLLQMQDLQYLGLLDPVLLLAQENPDERIVVLVDALDELRYSPAKVDIVEALASLPEVPANLRFVISTRPEEFLDRLLARADARELPLDVADADNWADLRTYTENVVGGDGWESALAEVDVSRQKFIDGLLDKAAGNFLYLKSVLSGIEQALDEPAKRERLPHLLRVEELPDDLGGLYGYFLSFIVKWARKEFGAPAWRKHVRPFLGILAVAQEPLLEQQIIALTELTPEDVVDLQRELQQFVEVADGECAAYRIYHSSFAEYLLNRKQNHDYWIDGRERHRLVADRYLSTWGGLEAGLPALKVPETRDLDGGYGLRHLAAHLAGASRIKDLHGLINQAWMAARFEGDDYRYDGFVADVMLAWQHAYDEALRQIERGEASAAMAECVRYTLIRTSINSLADNYAPELIMRALETGLWPLKRALSVAAKITDHWQRATAYRLILEISPSPLSRTEFELTTRQALAAAESIQNTFRGEAVVALAPRLSSGLLRDAWAVVQAIEDEPTRAKALTALASWLPADKQHAALLGGLAAAEAIDDDWYRAVTLATLVPRLSDVLLRDGLAAAANIKEPGARVYALAALAPQLSGNLLRDGVEATRAIQNEWLQPNALAALATLASQLSDEERIAVLHTGLRAAQTIQHPSERARALSLLAPQLSGDLLCDGLEVASCIQNAEDRARALVAFTPRLTEGQDVALRDTLAALEESMDDRSRSYVLASLAPHLSNDLLHEGLAAARAIRNKYFRGQALAALAVELNGDDRDAVLRDGLAAAQTIEDESLQAHTLASLASHLNGEKRDAVIRDGLVAARSIGDGYSRAHALVSLAQQSSGDQRDSALRDGLTAARDIGDGGSRAVALAVLVPELSGDKRGEALCAWFAAAQAIEDKSLQAHTLASLASHLNGEKRDAVIRDGLVAARSIGDGYSRAHALVSLAQQSSGDQRDSALRDGLTAARDIGDGGSRAVALAVLVPELSGDERTKALQAGLKAAKEGEDPWSRSQALALLIHHLGDENLHDGLEVVHTIEVPRWRAHALIDYAARFSGEKRDVALRDALNMALELSDLFRGSTLQNLAPQLPDELLSDGLAAAETVLNKREQADVVSALLRQGEKDTVLLRKIRTCIAGHLWENLLHSSRSDVLDFCAHSSLLAPSVVDQNTLAAIAGHIVDVCTRWTWL